MLLYLPERLYKIIENDKKYASMANDLTLEIFGSGNNIDFLKTMFNYENINPKIKEIQQYIKSVSPQEYQMELDLSFSDDLSDFKKDYDLMDVETKLYWLCEFEAGDMTATKEFINRNNQFLRLYKNFVLPSKKDYSEFIHCMYYSKLIFNKILELVKKDINYSLVTEFFKYENKIFNEVNSYSSLQAFKQMMFSKREQMYVLFYEYIGQFCKEYKETNTFIRRCLNNSDFKYNKFTYFRLMFNNMCFQQAVDKNNIQDAKFYLDNILKYISYAYNNKEFSIKSLNHYNNSFIDEFLAYSKFIFNVIQDYMPNCFNKWKFIENSNLSDLERRFYLNNLTDDENKLYNNYIKEDNNYSMTWINASKNILHCLDELYT